MNHVFTLHLFIYELVTTMIIVKGIRHWNVQSHDYVDLAKLKGAISRNINYDVSLWMTL